MEWDYRRLIHTYTLQCFLFITNYYVKERMKILFLFYLSPAMRSICLRFLMDIFLFKSLIILYGKTFSLHYHVKEEISYIYLVNSRCNGLNDFDS